MKGVGVSAIGDITCAPLFAQFRACSATGVVTGVGLQSRCSRMMYVSLRKKTVTARMRMRVMVMNQLVMRRAMRSVVEAIGDGEWRWFL